jgi:hypothetical protein
MPFNFFQRRNRLYATFVLAVDTLGFSERVKHADENSLFKLWDEIDQQYLNFRARIPNKIVFTTRRHVWDTREIDAIRLNDMFVAFSQRLIPNPDIRFLISGSLLYHQMLIQKTIPRGGLGFGLIAITLKIPMAR